MATWTLADLQARCRVGDQPVPTFDDAAAYAASVGRAIAPELKDPGLSADDYAGVVSVIQAHGLTDRTWVQSVFGSHLLRLRALEPRLRLMVVSAGMPSASTVKSIGADGVATTLSSLSIPRVHAYHAAKLRVWGWTARTAAAIRLVKAMRADGVVTDSPEAARKLYR